MSRNLLDARLRARGYRVPAVDRGVRPGRSLDAKERDIDRVLGGTKRVLESLYGDAPPRVVRGLALIHRHLFDPSLKAGRVYAAVPGPRFRRSFRKATGRSVRQYIEHARLLIAAQLLDYVDIELYLVADAVGYDHYETFSRAFRRHFGQWPSHYQATAVDASRPATAPL